LAASLPLLVFFTMVLGFPPLIEEAF
jgi:hypothetical protein